MESMGWRHLCLGCMSYIENPNIPCAHCGWTKNNENAIHQLAAGTRLGNYLIGRTLGQGGFGITYLAWDILHHQRVAIKEYYPSDIAIRSRDFHTVAPGTDKDRQNYQQGLQRFLQEAKSLSKFSKDSRFVSLKDFFANNGTAYIVMEYLEGPTLKELLRQKGCLSLERVIDLLKPIASALSTMHKTYSQDDSGKNNVLIHRDVSPDNIMFTKDGQAKLLDFGAARTASLKGSRHITSTVKAGYTPIEQFIGSGQAGAQGPWTDVYAFAATIYQAITGQIPPSAVDRQVRENLQRPSALGAKLSAHQEEVLLKGLSLNWKNRYQTVDEFYRALSVKSGNKFSNKKVAILSLLILSLGLLINVIQFLVITDLLRDNYEFMSLMNEIVAVEILYEGLNIASDIFLLFFVVELVRILWKKEDPKWLKNKNLCQRIIIAQGIYTAASLIVNEQIIYWLIYGTLTIGCMWISEKFIENR